MTIWHCHIAVSLDMRIARPDGSVDWLAEYPPDGLDFDGFLAGVDAILMGRATYDAVRRLDDWPHAEKPVTVITSRPLYPGAPPGIEIRDDVAAAVDELEARGHARVWIEGGGRLIEAMLRLGKLDILEMAIIPIVLGAGIPLFPDGAPETAFDLEQGRPWIRGGMHLVYRRRT